jgi:threonine/homoserine/homoserine lactone efflux protein
MTVFESIGLLFVVFVSSLGTAGLAYLAYCGYKQLSKELTLGKSCIEVSDEVVKDISVPVLRPQAVR